MAGAGDDHRGEAARSAVEGEGLHLQAGRRLQRHGKLRRATRVLDPGAGGRALEAQRLAQRVGDGLAADDPARALDDDAVEPRRRAPVDAARALSASQLASRT
jgi:hypothetical protein